MYPMYEDIRGYDAQKKELKVISDFFKDPDLYLKSGATLPKGAIIYGPPGTGKTLMSKALVNEAGVPSFFFSADIMYSEHSVSGSIHEFFKSAHENAPSIVIIDELDQIVNAGSFNRMTDLQSEAYRQLLYELDNINDSSVFVIATVNANISDMPGPLIRSGRLEKHIDVKLPRLKERRSILEYYTKDKKQFDEIDLDNVASYTIGFSCSSISSLCNNVLIDCISLNKKAEFLMFLDHIELIRNNSVRKDDEENDDSTIYHEIGHFIADYVLNKNIGMISINKYGNIEGQYTKVDRMMHQSKETKDYYINQCVICMSGFVCSNYMTKKINDGSCSDLVKIKEIYLHMVENNMISEKILSIALLSKSEGFTPSPYQDNNSKTCKDYEKFLCLIKHKSKRLIKKNIKLIKKLYERLLTKNVLLDDEIKSIINE